jgi:hypothetical protein
VLHIPAATSQHRTLAQTEAVRVPEDAEHIDVHHNPGESAAEAYPNGRHSKCRAHFTPRDGIVDCREYSGWNDAVQHTSLLPESNTLSSW